MVCAIRFISGRDPRLVIQVVLTRVHLLIGPNFVFSLGGYSPQTCTVSFGVFFLPPATGIAEGILVRLGPNPFIDSSPFHVFQSPSTMLLASAILVRYMVISPIGPPEFIILK